jgi:hypothetical protein
VDIVKIAGNWEIGWNTPFLEHDLWVYPLQEFGVEHWYMSPITGIAKSSSLTEVADIQEAINANPNLTVVWVEEFGKVPLNKFKHPKKALYITGRTSFSPMNAGLSKPKDLSVKVETLANGGGLWAHQAITMVLYDRMKKSWH